MTKRLLFVSSLLMTFALPALADVNVNSPANDSFVESPFSLSAVAATCSDQSVAVMSYSLDNGPDVTSVDGTSLEETVTSPVGTHTVHVKAWGEGGAVCMSEVDITVSGNAPSKSLVIPPHAIKVSSLQAMGHWKAIGDSGAKGKASGSSIIVHSPSLSGAARKFSSHYKGNGDVRYSLDFGDDREATNFAYDTWIYLNSSSNDVSNIEMDMNQVMSNGITVIYGVQCDGWSGTWDFAANTGTIEHHHDHWAHTKHPCNPHSWKIDTWHHLQATYSRNSKGDVTYHSVWLDGVEYPFNVTVLSAADLHWGSSLLITNFQVDGFHGSGSSTVYADQMTIYRW
jgi:hypothetical protein